MATFAELKSRGARKVYWLELDGIKWAFSDDSITQTNKGTLFTDALTPAFVFHTDLRLPRRVDSREIRVLRGDGRTGGFEVEILDAQTTGEPDGFLTWMFGVERASILRTNLTADVSKHAGGVGHDWTVGSTAGFANSGDLWCDLEMVSYTGKDATHFTTVSRAQLHSHAAGHKQIASSSQGVAIFPEVTDHPVEWEGRGGVLFVTYMDEDGALAGTPATARSVAHKVRGILKSFHETGGVYTLTFRGIDTLLDRQVMRGAARARVVPKVTAVASGTHEEDPGDLTTSPVMRLVQEDIGGANNLTFIARIAPGTYSADRFVELVNQSLSGITAIGGGAFSGQVQLTLEGDRLGVFYQTDGAAAKPLWAFLSVRAFGGGPAASEYWRGIGIVDPVVEDDNRVLVTDDEAPATDTNYWVHYVRRPVVAIDGTMHHSVTVSIGSDADDSPIADFSAAVGEDFMVLRSSAGTQLFAVVSISAVNKTVVLATVFENNEGVNAIQGPVDGFVHLGSFDEPIWLMRVYYGPFDPGLGVVQSSNIAMSTLPLLLSTGVAAYNDPTYDLLPEGIGIEFPHETPAAGANSTESWVDVASFERFFAEAMTHIVSVNDILIEPMSMREWLVDRVAFLGGYLVVENGQLKVRKGLAVMQHEGVAVTQSEIRSKGNRGVERTFKVTAGGIRHRWGWNWRSDDYNYTWMSLAGSLKAANKDNIFEFADKGIVSTMEHVERMQLAMTADFGRENPLYTESFDGSLMDLEAGQSVNYSDEGGPDSTDQAPQYIGLPNLQGTRGHSGSRMLVVKAGYSHDRDSCDVRMLQMRRKRGGFAPSGWIESFATVTGKSELTLSANVFGAAADGADAAWFAANDLVRVVRVNPTLAGADPGVQTQEAGLVVESVTGNVVRLTTTMAVFLPPIAGRQLAIIYDEYASGQRAGAKDFCHVSDNVDINGTGDEPYDWG